MPHFYYFMNGNGDAYCMLSTWCASPISFHVSLQQPYEVGNIIILESKMLCDFTVPHNSWVAEHRFKPRPLTWENAVLTAPHPARCPVGPSSPAALLGGAAMAGSLRRSLILLWAPQTRLCLAYCLVSLAGSTLSRAASPFAITSLLHARVGQ